MTFDEAWEKHEQWLLSIDSNLSRITEKQAVFEENLAHLTKGQALLTQSMTRLGNGNQPPN